MLGLLVNTTLNVRLLRSIYLQVSLLDCTLSWKKEILCS